MYGQPVNDSALSGRGPMKESGSGMTTDRQMEVSMELAALEKSVDVLQSRMTKLYDRLTPVMSSPTAGESQAQLPDPSICQLADSIRRQNKIVQMIDGAASEILHRLEL